MVKRFGSICLSAVLSLAFSMPAFGEAVVFYDFNDASNDDTAVDITGNGNDGEVIDAEYTDDGDGRTGQPGDRAMDFGDFDNGAYVDIVTAEDLAFESLWENDMATLTMWIFGNDQQPVDQWTFYAGPERQLGSHIPWGNSNVYFDVAGTPGDACCNDRINTFIELETFAEEWNHYAFVKNGEETAIYQNGEFLLDGVDMRPLNEITEFFVGVGPEGDQRSYAGLMDDFGVYNTALTEEQINDVMENGFGGDPPPLTGDYNDNGLLDDGDLDLQSQGIKDNDLAFDLNGDGATNLEDRVLWVNELKNTWMGDSDLNGVFDSSDFVLVFGVGKYETGQMAGWAEGDWNADMLFNTSDFVVAFGNGGYEMGPKEGGVNPATAAVPEPSSIVLLLLGCVIGFLRRR